MLGFHNQLEPASCPFFYLKTCIDQTGYQDAFGDWSSKSSREQERLWKKFVELEPKYVALDL